MNNLISAVGYLVFSYKTHVSSPGSFSLSTSPPPSCSVFLSPAAASTHQGAGLEEADKYFLPARYWIQSILSR
jgi:hypothetical protein